MYKIFYIQDMIAKEKWYLLNRETKKLLSDIKESLNRKTPNELSIFKYIQIIERRGTYSETTRTLLNKCREEYINRNTLS